MLIGYDVEGFSRTVQKASLANGRGAGELAAARILAGQSAVAELMAREGFDPIDSIGDGAIYACRGPGPGPRRARALDRVTAELRYRHVQATGLHVRAAWSHGQLQVWTPRVALSEQEAFAFGPGIAGLHERIRKAGSSRTAAPAPRRSPDTLADGGGEIVERAFAFFRLTAPNAWTQVDDVRLDLALDLLKRWADGLGGKLQRLTHDEKGVHVRIGLPDDAPPGAGWTEALGSAGKALRTLGWDGAVGAARGPAYFGRAPGGACLVHGAAVNRAAKLMNSAPAGHAAVDETLQRARVELRSAARLFGRGAEVRAAAAWLSGDGPRLVLIRGEPGIGKTHLMRDIFDAASGGVRAWTEGTPSLALQPHGLWRDAIRRVIAAALPSFTLEARLAWARGALDDAGVDRDALSLVATEVGVETLHSLRILDLPGGARARLSEQALLAFASCLSADGLVLACDDLHLADPASIALLVSVLESDARISIVATARPTSDHALQALAEQLSTLPLTLGPLGETDIADLVVSVAAAGGDKAAAIALSGGNPLAAIQLAAAGVSEEASAEIVQILDRRLDALTRTESDVLRALAIGERDWTQAQLETMSGLGRLAASSALQRLAHVHLVARDLTDGRARPAHPLIREAVLRRAPLGVRRRLADAGARALLRERRVGARVADAELAALWDRAGAGPRAALLYERAAEEALAQGGADAAGRLLELALAAAPGTGRRLRWMSELANARWSDGKVGAANQMARAVLKEAKASSLTPGTRSSAALAAAIQSETGQFLGNLGDIIGGAVTANRYAAGGREHLEAKGRTFSALGYLLGLARAPWLADQIIAAGERLSRTSGDARPKAFAVTAKGLNAYVFTRWAEGDAALLEAKAACAGLGEHHLEEVLETTLGMGAHLRGDGPRALGHFEDLGRRAVARRHRLHEGWAAYASAQTLMHMGQPHRAWELLMYAEQSLEGSEDIQSLHICLGLRAFIAWRLGERATALEAAEAVGGMSRALPPTNYTSLEPYSAAPIVGGLIAGSSGDKTERALGLRLLKTNLPALTRYATIFPIARPRRAMAQAIVEVFHNPTRSRARLAAAADLATRGGLRFEARFASYLAEQPPFLQQQGPP